MATTEDVKIKVTATGIDQLEKISKTAGDATTKINGLAGAILGIGFGAFINGAIQSADRIADFSQAANISIASLKGLEAAMNAAGGNGKNLEKSINTLYAAIDQANGGSQGAVDAFQKVGVSLNDLKNASEADILQKTLNGLAQMPAGAERSAAAAQLLSKSFRGIDPKQMLDALDTGKFIDAEKAIQDAADANQKLEQSFATLQQGALNAIQPIVNLMGSEQLTTDTATKIIQGLGVAIGIAFAASTIANILQVVKGIQALNVVSKTAVATQAALAALQGPKGWVMLAGAAAASAAAIYGINQLLDDTVTKGEDAAGAVKGVTGGGTGVTQANPQAGPAGRTQTETPQAKAQREARNRIALLGAEFDKQTALGSANEITKINAERDFEIAQATKDIMGKTEVSLALRRQELAEKTKIINLKAEQEVSKIKTKNYIEQWNLQQEINDENAKAIAEYQQNVDKATLSAWNQVDAYKRAREETQERFDFETSIAGLGRNEADLARQIFDARRKEKDEIRALGLIEDLSYAQRVKREAEIKNITNQSIDDINKRGAALKAAQADFVGGWKSAFKEYADDAANAADQATQVFGTFTQGFEDAFVSFVQTGKLSFKDLANSVIADLARIQARRLLVNLIDGGGSFLGGLFGRAGGGNVNALQPYMVGESGPEMFVPSSNGSIIPNSRLGGGGMTAVTYNINAVDASSFKQLVASDPSFIYAVTEQGRRSLPQTRR